MSVRSDSTRAAVRKLREQADDLERHADRIEIQDRYREGARLEIEGDAEGAARIYAELREDREPTPVDAFAAAIRRIPGLEGLADDLERCHALRYDAGPDSLDLEIEDAERELVERDLGRYQRDLRASCIAVDDERCGWCGRLADDCRADPCSSTQDD